MAQGLLLLHAFPLDHTMWDDQQAEFGSALKVVAPDFPGLGSSPLPPVQATMESAALAARHAVDNAGVDSVVVCGLSMGGYVALAFARLYPGLVSGLVLANTRSGADDAAGKDRRYQLAARLRAEGNGFLAQDPPPLLSAGASAELVAKVKASIAAQPAAGIAGAAVAMANRPDATASLAGIKVPALVITSDNDTLIPAAASSPMAEQLPNATLAVIENAGHLSNLEQPAEFNRLLREHLTRAGALA